MKLYGYVIGNDETLHKMKEVTIQADAKRIRSIAEWLHKTADLMEKHGDGFGHDHYSFKAKKLPKGIDLIVHN